MLRGLAQKIKNYMLLAAQSVTADVASASVDLANLRSFGFLVSVGTFSFTGSNKIGLEIYESDDNSTFTIASAADHVGGVIKELSAATDDETVHLVEYRGTKRYIKLNLNVSGTVAAPIAVVGHSSDLEIMPS